MTQITLRDLDNRDDNGAPFEFTGTAGTVIGYLNGPLRSDITDAEAAEGIDNAIAAIHADDLDAANRHLGGLSVYLRTDNPTPEPPLITQKWVIEADVYRTDDGHDPLPRIIGPFDTVDAANHFMTTLGPLWGEWNAAPVTFPAEITPAGSPATPAPEPAPTTARIAESIILDHDSIRIDGDELPWMVNTTIHYRALAADDETLDHLNEIRDAIARTIHDGPSAYLELTTTGAAPHPWEECDHQDTYLGDADSLIDARDLDIRLVVQPRATGDSEAAAS